MILDIKKNKIIISLRDIRVKQLALFIIFLVVFMTSCSQKKSIQYSKTLNELANSHQKSIDKGQSMMADTRKYSIQMDSMLNLVYKDLIVRLNEVEKDSLITEQRKWLKNRDAEFRNYSLSLDTVRDILGFIPRDDRMFVYDKQGEYIRLRVLELVSYLHRVE